MILKGKKEMREVNTNVDLSKIKNQNAVFNAIEKSESSQSENVQKKEIKDFSNHTEILGRSQVNKTDNLKADVAFCSENQKTVELSDKLFEIAYEKLKDANDPHAYEKACAIATSEDAKALLK